MRTQIAHKVKRAFTLIEILIVVVILGILAAIVIPQFTDASQEAMISSVRSQLQTIRSQIELYRVKEGNLPPADLFANTTNGLVELDYLQSSPVNPFIDGTFGTAVGSAAGTNVGWVYDATTGDLFAVYVNGTTAGIAGGADGTDASNPW